MCIVYFVSWNAARLCIKSLYAHRLMQERRRSIANALGSRFFAFSIDLISYRICSPINMENKIFSAEGINY